MANTCDIREIRTARLRLRRWIETDRAPFAAMNADPDVMEFMPAVLDRAASDAFVERIKQHFAQHGFGLWAVEVREAGSPSAPPSAPPSGPSVGAFIGYVGLMRPRFTAAFTPCVEVGWRLARNAWGRGFATEAAREVCRVGFDEVGLSEIVSFTVPANVRSRRVMERLGMERDPAEDFDHPLLPDGNALRRHVLYRLPRARLVPVS